jgi:hypothetical protein
MQEFEVPTDPLEESELSHIREDIASFLLSQVINKKESSIVPIHLLWTKQAASALSSYFL